MPDVNVSNPACFEFLSSINKVSLKNLFDRLCITSFKKVVGSPPPHSVCEKA